MTEKIWSDKEIEILNSEYSKKTNKEILEMLNNKTVEQLRNKLQRLNLKKDKDGLSKCYLGVSSERMKENNPMKNKETIDKMRKSKLEFYEDLEKRGLKLKHKKHGYDLIIKFTEEQKRFIEKKYLEGYTLKQIGEMMGFSTNTIKRRMIKWGMQRRGSFMDKKIKIISDDGHRLESASELEIDNWLFHHNIIHQVHKKIADTNYKTDFYLPNENIYIEYWGLSKLNSYKLRMQNKIAIYKSLGLKLISILPNQSITKRLSFILNKDNNEEIIEYEIKN